MLEYLIVVIACLIFSGFFSGSETALLRVRAADLNAKSEDTKNLSATAAKFLLKSPSKLLVTILLGNNVVNILGAACASALAVHYFGEKTGVVVATVGMTIAVLIFSEIFPKAVASRDPKRVSYIVALPLYVVHRLSRPIHFLFEKLLDPIITRLVGEEKDSADVNAYDSLLRLASQIRAQNPKLGPVSIIQSTVKAQKLHAEDVMVQKSEIVGLPKEESVQGALQKMLSHRFTRFPVYDGSLDKMIGLIHFKDLVDASQRAGSTLEQIIRPVLRVPEKKPILPLLSDMQKSSIHMAIVKDEFGNTHGLVTQEDILEELVGEIRDEFDSEELSAIYRVSETQFRVMGKVLVRDFNRTSHWNLLAPENETVGGVLFNRIGTIPKVGDHVDVDGFTFRVIEMAGNRINQIQIEKRIR